MRLLTELQFCPTSSQKTLENTTFLRVSFYLKILKTYTFAPFGGNMSTEQW